MGRYDRSMEFLERAERITCNGSQVLSKRSDAFPRGAYPSAIARSIGCNVWTVDGQKMIDFICGLGAAILGHSHPTVVEAIERQVRDGIIASLPHVLEAEVSEKFCAAVGHEMIRWVSTGSEACTGVMRMARAATGKTMIITSDQSYHGWHDVFAASRPIHPGIPEEMCRLIATFKYNDLDDLHRVLNQYTGQVACVIMEPCLHEAPKPGFLAGVKRLTHEHNALFVLDEMILGFRMAIGGASEYYNVQPDLATFGKCIAGGLPLGCIVGKREYMKESWFVSGTFSGNPVSLAACSAVLDIYQREPVVERLWERGGQFRDMFNMHAVTMGVPAICDGYAVKPRIRFTYDSDRTNNLALSLFVQELARLGVLWHPAGGNLSAAMTRDDIAFAVRSCQEALALVREAARDNRWSALTGKPIQPSSFVRTA